MAQLWSSLNVYAALRLPLVSGGVSEDLVIVTDHSISHNIEALS